jgi:hypothetical protein
LADVVSRYDLQTNWAGRTAFLQGWAKWSNGAEESSLAEMRRGIAIYREQGKNWQWSSFEAALAEAEASAGKTGAGLRRPDDALIEAEHREHRWYEAQITGSAIRRLLESGRCGSPSSLRSPTANA